MEHKACRIAPYEKEHWDWLLYAGAVTFLVWCFSDYFWFDMTDWGYAVIFLLGCVGFGLARLRQRGVELFLSEDGIRVCNGGQETVPLTPWSAFECGYILEVVWYGRHDRYCDTYFLLTGKPLDREALDEISFHLSNTKPCGIWKDYIAVKTSRGDNQKIRNTIGALLPILEWCYDWKDFEEEE